MLEFRTALVDECGEILFWIDELKDSEIEEIKSKYPESRTKCIQIGGEPTW